MQLLVAMKHTPSLLCTRSRRVGPALHAHDLTSCTWPCFPHLLRRLCRWVCYPLFVMAEIAIAACDLAEVIGAAVALQLLFGLPLWAGVLITIADVALVMLLEGRGFRWLEIFVIGLILIIFTW